MSVPINGNRVLANSSSEQVSLVVLVCFTGGNILMNGGPKSLLDLLLSLWFCFFCLQVRTTRGKVRAITSRINNILKGYPGEASEKSGRLCVAVPAGKWLAAS
jgi:hypothetical protein